VKPRHLLRKRNPSIEDPLPENGERVEENRNR
jgi:hypothetical protein